jgi:hypothetical protein
MHSQPVFLRGALSTAMTEASLRKGRRGKVSCSVTCMHFCTFYRKVVGLELASVCRGLNSNLDRFTNWLWRHLNRHGARA